MWHGQPINTSHTVPQRSGTPHPPPTHTHTFDTVNPPLEVNGSTTTAQRDRGPSAHPNAAPADASTLAAGLKQGRAIKRKSEMQASCTHLRR